jgi:zinc transporter ZupT
MISKDAKNQEFIHTFNFLFWQIPKYSVGVAGDFCTLVRAGYSTYEAIMAQLLTAMAAFAGTATAIAVTGESWMEERLLWITAGGFIYLAGTTILPDVLNDNGNVATGLRSRRIAFRLTQLLAFCSGIIFMRLVDWLSGEAHDHHQSHSHIHRHDVPDINHVHQEL